MDKKESVSLRSFAVLAAFFALLFSVFLYDLYLKSFGREKKLNQHFFMPVSKIEAALKKMSRPAADVVEGKDGWLFYRPYMNLFKNEKINMQAVDEIASMNNLLIKKGISLITVPVPLKIHLHSEQVVDVSSVKEGYKKYIEILRDRGVEVIDLIEPLNFSDSYLKTDTHWSPQAVETLAQLLSRRIAPEKNKKSLVNKELVIVSSGKGNLSKTFSQLVSPVYETDKLTEGLTPSTEAEVLLLGDSFSNIFSDESLGWGRGRGLAERLSYHIEQPIDKIAVNNGGESGCRNLLMDELATGFERLKNTKYIIWEFHFSEFGKEEWSHFSFPEKVEPNFIKVDKEMDMSGVILGMSSVDTDSVYKDQLVSVRMKTADNKQTLFRTHVKKNNSLTAAAKLRVGDFIRVKLKPLTDLTSKTARTEFPELDLQLQSYAYGEFEKRDDVFGNWSLYLVIILIGIFCIRVFRGSL